MIDPMIEEVQEYMTRMYEEGCQTLAMTKGPAVTALVLERLRTLEKLANCTALQPVLIQFRQSREAVR